MKKIFYAALMLGLLSPLYSYDLAQKNGTGYKLGEQKWASLESLKEAADKSEPYAMYALGWVYDEGDDVKEDDNTAKKWYKKAFAPVKKLAERGNAHAMVLLGEMYDEGNGVKESKKKAAEWYQKAAAKGNADALYLLAELYDDGEGVPKDKKKARQLYKEAADKGHAEAKKELLDND